MIKMINLLPIVENILKSHLRHNDFSQYKFYENADSYHLIFKSHLNDSYFKFFILKRDLNKLLSKSILKANHPNLFKF